MEEGDLVRQKLLEEWPREEARPFSGWDSSYLEGRMVEELAPRS